MSSTFINGGVTGLVCILNLYQTPFYFYECRECFDGHCGLAQTSVDRHLNAILSKCFICVFLLLFVVVALTALSLNSLKTQVLSICTGTPML